MSRRKVDTRTHSSLVFDGLKQTPSRAMLRAVGFTDRDFRKPQVGVASTWSTLTPCNMHIDRLAAAAAAGADARRWQEHDLRHHHGFRRDLDGHAGDALFARVARGDRGLDRDGGRGAGLRRPGRDRRLRQEHARLHDGDRAARTARPCSSTAARYDRASKRRDIVSVFEAVGARAQGAISERAARARSSAPSIPGPGSCGGMYTANTMASAIEALGHEPGEQLGAGGGVAPQARRRRARRTCGGRADPARHPSVRHPDARGVRERDRREHRAVRLDERRAASARDRACGRGAAGTRRLHAHRQPRPGAGGSAAYRAALDVGSDPNRRDPAAHAHLAGGGAAPR